MSLENKARSRVFPLLALTLLLVGCGNRQPPVEAAQPVLVSHPGGDVDASVMAFAGEVHAREESTLSFRVPGNLVRRMVDVGDRVGRGDVLAELDAADLRLQAQASQAQLAASEAELARVSADRGRYGKLAQQQLVSRSTLDAQDAAYAAAAGQVRAIRAQLGAARNAAGYAELRAPRDGVIAGRAAEAGQVVAAGQPIFTLAADTGRDVLIALPESSVRAFHVGDPALVEPWNASGQRLPGVIRELSPAADPQTRTYAARIALTGPAADAVQLGQSARVYLQGGGHSSLSIPLAAVQQGPNGRSAVWIVDTAKRTATLRPVQLGAFGSDRVPVLSGVTSGDWVVAAGGHLLHEGERVLPVDRDNRPVPAAAAMAGR
jgi:multidrug efflux system membrane fusion protein